MATRQDLIDLMSTTFASFESKLKTSITESVSDAIQAQSDVLTPANQSIQLANSPINSTRHRGYITPLLRQKLKDVTGATHFLFPAQAQAVDLMCRADRDGIIVLPTGAGKGTAIILAVSMDGKDKTSILIVPRKALLTQMHERAKKAGLDAVIWSHNDISYRHPPNLYIVSAEHIRHGDFLHRLRQLEAEGRLVKFIVDEAHLVAQELGFRECMAAFGVLRDFRVAIYLVSGSIPPLHEKFLCRVFHISSYSFVRMPTIRPDLEYHVIPVEESKSPSGAEPKNIFLAVRDWIRDRAPVMANFYKEEREIQKADYLGMVFCQTRDDAKDLANLLEVPFLISEKVDDSNNNDDRISEWQNAKASDSYRWIVTTSILGSGVDFERVRFVLHCGRPRSLLDLYQFDGRCNRPVDGLEGPWGMCVVFDNGISWSGGQLNDDMSRFLGQDEIKTYANQHSICRRYITSEFLDEEGSSCSSLGPCALPCDVCFGNVQKWVSPGGWQKLPQKPVLAVDHRTRHFGEIERSIDIHRNITRTAHGEKIILRNRLQELRSKIIPVESICCYCILSNGLKRSHTESHCKMRPQKDQRVPWWNVTKICKICSLPASDEFHTHAGDENRICNFKKIVANMFSAMLHRHDIVTRYLQKTPENIVVPSGIQNDRHGYTKWLAQVGPQALLPNGLLLLSHCLSIILTEHSTAIA